MKSPLLFYCIKQIDSMLPCVCSRLRLFRLRQNVLRKTSIYLTYLLNGSSILCFAEKLRFNLLRWIWSIGHIRSYLNLGRLSGWNHKLQQHQTIQCCATAVSCHNRRWVWFLSRHTCFYCFHTSKW